MLKTKASLYLLLTTMTLVVIAATFQNYQQHKTSVQTVKQQQDATLEQTAKSIPFVLTQHLQKLDSQALFDANTLLSQYAANLAVEQISLYRLDNDQLTVTLSSHQRSRAPVLTQALKAAFSSINPVFETTTDSLSLRHIYQPFVHLDNSISIIHVATYLPQEAVDSLRLDVGFIVNASTLVALALLLALGYGLYLRASLIRDHETDLPNALALEANLRRQKNDSQLALLVITNLEDISHLYGRATTEKALLAFILRLQQHLGTSFEVYRLAFEKLAILRKAGSEVEMHQRLRDFDFTEAALGEPYLLFTVTLGLAHGAPHTLLENASLAVHSARLQQQPFLVYSEALGQLKQHRHTNLKISQEVHEAIGKEQVVPYFQPVVHIGSGEVYQYECLARIVRQDGSVLTPPQFLSVVNRSFWDAELTKMMFVKSACQFAKSEVSWSMNLTCRDLLNSDLLHFFVDYLKRYPNASRVWFELAEADVLPELARCKEAIKALQKTGAKVLLDDFGSASRIGLADLLHLQVDGLKLDGRLIDMLTIDPDAKLFVEHISSFAKQTSLVLIAEMVEGKAALDALETCGVEYAQGYYFGPAEAAPQRYLKA